MVLQLCATSGLPIRNGRPLIFATDQRRIGGRPRLVAAAHILSGSAGHCDLRGFYNARWNLPVSAIADDAGSIKSQVGANTPLAVTGLKPQTLAGSFSAARDGPARVT
jgi:hypothetical protein